MRDVGYHSFRPACFGAGCHSRCRRESTGAPRSPKRTWDENDGRSPTIAFAPSTATFIPVALNRSTPPMPHQIFNRCEVPKGRLKVAQDVVLGNPHEPVLSPAGTAENLDAGIHPPLPLS